MRIVTVVVFSVLMMSCASGPDTKTNVPRPEGVPSCDAWNPYGGFTGSQEEMEGGLVIYASPYHLNDMMYLMMGPKAEENMVLMNIGIVNSGVSVAGARRKDINVVGASGETQPALEPEQMLALARGSDTKPKNHLEEIGDGVLETKFVDQIEVRTGDEGEIGIAFSLPLPADPTIHVTTEYGTAKLWICWSPPL